MALISSMKDSIITSSNLGTAFDIAFTLLEMLTTKNNTEKLMGFK